VLSQVTEASRTLRLMLTSSAEKGIGDHFGFRCPLCAVPVAAEYDIPVIGRALGRARLAL
jgi:hypothetical protein